MCVETQVRRLWYLQELQRREICKYSWYELFDHVVRQIPVTKYSELIIKYGKTVPPRSYVILSFEIKKNDWKTGSQTLFSFHYFLFYVFCVHSSEKTTSSVTTQQFNNHASNSMTTTVVHREKTSCSCGRNSHKYDRFFFGKMCSIN